LLVEVCYVGGKRRCELVEKIGAETAPEVEAVVTTFEQEIAARAFWVSIIFFVLFGVGRGRVVFVVVSVPVVVKFVIVP
jgi:hypothetical protein